MRQYDRFTVRTPWSWAWLLLTAVVIVSLPPAVDAQPFSLAQITNTTGTTMSNFSPSINATGTRIVFASDRDLTPGSPGNADANTEIFLFETSTGLFTQITHTTGGAFLLDVANSSPAISADGTRIAFESNRDLTPGSPGNADSNREIFLFDTTTGLFTQITNTIGSSFLRGGANRAPTINANGTRIAFISDRDITPGSPGNADGNFEIFLFDTATGLFTQITNTVGQTSASPSIDAAGTRIALMSSDDLTPGNPGNADHNSEIFLFDTATGLFTQITNTVGGFTTGPSISAAGTRIAFESTSDLTPGDPGNADGNPEIFLFDTATGLVTQITNTTGGTNSSASINATGTRIAFQSTSNIAPGSPGNADGHFEIFLFDTATGLFTQITNSNGGFTTGPSINAAGTRIAFQSTNDLTPGNSGNADGNFEIFLAGSAEGIPPIPALSVSMQIAVAALLLIAGLHFIRRRSTGRRGRTPWQHP